jgi:tRNA(Arg) A34 adenosine deaminase TadA
VVDLRQLARENREGYPFSAMIIEKSTGRSVVAVNRVEFAKDPTAHAEVEAIREAGKKGFNFSDCRIISSGEPCPMCAAALAWAGIREVYYLDPCTVAVEKGYCIDQDAQRVNKLLNLGLTITRVEHQADAQP